MAFAKESMFEDFVINFDIHFDNHFDKLFWIL